MHKYVNNNILIGCGLQSYILSNKGAKKLLINTYNLPNPIDIFIRNQCNKELLIWNINNIIYVKRNYNRLSSISNIKVSNANDKQSYLSIIDTIKLNIKKQNKNIDESTILINYIY